MDFKHFSHQHNLSYHQMPPGRTETHCSGCNLPGLSTAYMCWQCQFFLHEQCFLASRSITHPSHSSHPLSLLPSPTYPSGSFLCNSCSLPGTGFSYSCPHCDFDLHVHCANNHYPTETTNHVLYPTETTNRMSYPTVLNLKYSVPNHTPNFNPQFANYTPENPTHQPIVNSPPNARPPRADHPPPLPKVAHFSHHHPLNLVEVREADNIICSGCEEKLSGSAYRCSEPNCKFSLHKACFGLPRELQHNSHLDHPLALLLSPDHNMFTCNACLSNGTAFNYHCSACNFDLHVKCAFLPETVRRRNHNHPLALFYSLPINKEEIKDMDCTCDVCQGAVDIENCWFYCCKECDFGTHLDCVNAKANPKEDLIAAALLELQMLQLQSKLTKPNADRP